MLTPRHLWLSLAMLAILAGVAAAAPAPLLEQGRAAMHHGDLDGAIALYEKAVAESPNNAEAHFALGSAYGRKAQTGGMIAAATLAPKMKSELETAVTLDPKLVDARFTLVELYAAAPPMMGGSYDKAFEQARAIQPLDPLLAHRANAFIYTQQKKPELARQEYLDGLREQPRSARAHGYLGMYLAGTEKNYAGALAEFDTALRLDPTYMPAWYHYGRAAALGDTALVRGEATLRKYLGHTPTDREPPLANAHYYLGLVCEKQGRKAEAKQHYEAAIALDPTLKDAAEALKRVS